MSSARNQLLADIVGPLPRFVAVGALSTLAGVTIIMALHAWTSVGELAANALSYIICIPVAFVLNGRWTFRGAILTRAMASRYACAVVLAYLTNVLVLSISLEWLGLSAQWSQAFALASYSGTLFLLSRFQVFAASDR